MAVSTYYIQYHTSVYRVHLLLFACLGREIFRVMWSFVVIRGWSMSARPRQAYSIYQAPFLLRVAGAM